MNTRNSFRSWGGGNIVKKLSLSFAFYDVLIIFQKYFSKYWARSETVSKKTCINVWHAFVCCAFLARYAQNECVSD
jgi:hypothetical protein